MIELTKQQQSATAHLKKWKVGALFMEAGTGKTRVACNIINDVDVDLVVWIGPLATIRRTDGTSVIDEINKWGGLRCGNVIYTGIESLQASDRIFVNLLNDMQQAKHVFLVVDESIKIKNMDAKRTKRLLELALHAEYRIILNGTPLTKNILDLYAQIQFLSPKILNMSEGQYKNTFCNYTTVTKKCGYYSYTKEYITGYANIDYLYSLIRHYVYECDLSLNVSQKYNSVYYEIDEQTIEDYNYLKDLYLNDEMLMFKNNNIFLEMTQKMQHLYSCDPAKVEAVKDILKEVPEDKTIIFCKYIDSRTLCEATFPKAAVLSYQKEAFGLNMQHYCHTIYFDKIWDLALRIQSSRRTFRQGQDYNCTYYDLTGNVGLERMIDNNISKKVSMAEYFKFKTKEDLKKEL